MGIIIRVKDASFEESAIGFAPAVTRGLSYWNYFGATDEKLCRNLASGGVKSVKSGNPVLFDEYATLGPAGYITTQSKQSADLTIIAVFRPSFDGSAQVVSSNSSNNPRVPPYTGKTYGASLWTTAGIPADSSVNVSFNQNVFDGDSSHPGNVVCSPSLMLQPLNSWLAIAGWFDATTAVAGIRNLTTMATATKAAVAPYTIADLGTLPFGVGYGYSAGLGTADKDVAFVAVYNARLTDAELSAVYEQAKLYLGKRGIVV